MRFLSFSPLMLAAFLWAAPALCLVAAPAQAQHGDEHAAHGDAHGDEHGAHDAHGGGHGSHELDWWSLTRSEGHEPGIGWAFINFFVWLGLIVFLLRKPLADFLTNRRTSIVEGIEEAKKIKEDADAKYKEYTERIENMDAELERLRQEMRDAGLAERDRLVNDAARRGEKMREEARFLIDQQMKQLREDLTREAIEAAVKAAEDILVKATSEADQKRLAEAYLGTLKTSLEQKSREQGGRA